jgi:hypothetical protein
MAGSGKGPSQNESVLQWRLYVLPLSFGTAHYCRLAVAGVLCRYNARRHEACTSTVACRVVRT